jgi:hypothetical protein
VVSFGPWLLGGVLAVTTRVHGGFPLTRAGGFAGADAGRWVDFADDWFALSSFALPFVVTALVALWTVVLAPRNRWTVATLATAALAGVVLLMSFGDGFVNGQGSLFGYGFVALGLAVVTLQIPVCFALSAWLCVPLRVVPRGSVSSRRTPRARG